LQGTLEDDNDEVALNNHRDETPPLGDSRHSYVHFPEYFMLASVLQQVEDEPQQFPHQQKQDVAGHAVDIQFRGIVQEIETFGVIVMVCDKVVVDLLVVTKDVNVI